MTSVNAPGRPESAGPMPVLYFGHGAPPLADDPLWTGQLASWSADLPRPTAILIVSAHWEAGPLTIGATRTVPLVYDFWGFPQRYYEVTYAAPGAPELAAKVRGLLNGHGVPVADAPERGLDHGAYVPLKEMYPDADVPVLQISMPTLDPQRLFELGRRLAPLRDEGVLIMGSGFLTHNLSCVDMSRGPGYTPPAWSQEFDDWADRAARSGDIDALLDWAHKAPAADIAHPRSEHLAPLFVALGAGNRTGETPRSVIDGFWYGMSKRSFQLD
ncbi:dioxygenase [Marinactinospora thermotolerans]|uniref:Aromatic ring-opening dioxygenase, catalytic subunit, LigB family n=1 Tax=Marinactinospora thermotolerans DSM 45154 TaxID=1122192 RepID=A0A1T4TEL5_9ACTN|nr:class III extradiol ring-cleavage dioxygenase [Marinactinospora thermotolerans]SKA38897.1 Aromatic ring-opening dioxygenase, catalytic subunit, LigB family [Marinactinospora thermotolerans DSM 45154]